MDLDDALRDVAGHRRILIASDFDGTLSEIVPVPDEAQPVEGAVSALSDLAALSNVDLLLVSGRRLDDLRARFDGGLPEAVLTVGEHGAAWPDRRIEPPEGLERLAEGFRALSSTADGAEVEVKHSAVTFHLRNVDERVAERLAGEVLMFARETVDGLDGDARIERGHGVVEVAFDSADKSHAVLEVKQSTGAGAVVFFGDDTSDEAVFGVLGPEDVGVKVGDGPTAARFRVSGPAQVIEALELLVFLRS